MNFISLFFWKIVSGDYFSFKWTRRLTLLTPVIVIISIMTAGGGHGTPIVMLLCYPGFFLLKLDGGTWFWVMLLGQFPLYGLIIDLGAWKLQKNLATGVVVLFHLILVIIQSSDQEFLKRWE